MARRISDLPQKLWMVKRTRKSGDANFYGPYTREGDARRQATAAISWWDREGNPRTGKKLALKEGIEPCEVIELTVEQVGSYRYDNGEILEGEEE